MKTYSAKPGTVNSSWHLLDAEGQILGRLASKIAVLLMGKHKPQYTPHMLDEVGDSVIVTGCELVAVTGNKLKDKTYYRHTQYPGGIKSVSLEKLLATHPERVITNAVARMLPKNKLGRKLLTRLKVYTGKEHPHEAQKPIPYKEVQ